MRLVTGLPRSFVYIGNGGLLLKRYFLHDPYAHSDFAYLAKHYLWKLAVFYICTIALILSLFLFRAARGIVWIFFAGVAPVLAFAVFVFEPGSAERYLPLYPFVCLAVAYVLSQASKSGFGLVMFAFIVLTLATNVPALWKTEVQRRNASAKARVELLHGRVIHVDLVALVTLNDNVYQFTSQYPFDAINRRGQLPVFDIIEVSNLRVLRWKQRFAQRALEVRNQSGAVWISTRVLAERPAPDWEWAEGDDPRIRWRDIPAFFRQFSYSESVGGADGFLKLAFSSDNLNKLEGEVVENRRLGPSSSPPNGGGTSLPNSLR